MAGTNFHFDATLQSATDPKTILQVVAATNVRVLLHGILIRPLGSTSASAPLEWDLIKQSDAGASSALPAAQIHRLEQVGAEVLQTTGLITFTSEPANAGAADVRDEMSLHQQGGGWIWTPLKGPIVIPGGTRLGFRNKNTQNINCKYRLILEE